MTRDSKNTPAVPPGRAAPANLFDTIARSLDQLRPSERKVASVVLADPEAAVGLTLSMLAERSAVSEPTIVRFCRSLGCEGYHQFRMELTRLRRTVQKATAAANESWDSINELVGERPRPAWGGTLHPTAQTPRRGDSGLPHH